VKVYWTLEARIIHVVKPERIEIVTIKHYWQNLPGNRRRLVTRK